MKLPSGKRFGQSGQQLTTAVLFSFFLHAILFLTILFFHFAVWPRVSIPPFYAVKLVGLPPDAAVPIGPSPNAAPPASEKPAARPEPPKPKAHRKAERAPKTARKGALPDLAPQSKKKAVEAEQERPEKHDASPARASGPQTGAPGAVGENVALAVPKGFKPELQPYLDTVRRRIGANWNPPPDAPDAKVRVIFSVNRSGWVGEVTLDDRETRGTFQFRQAAIRAIRACNPLPALPDEFSRQTLDFSVDLMAVEQ